VGKKSETDGGGGGTWTHKGQGKGNRKHLGLTISEMKGASIRRCPDSSGVRSLNLPNGERRLQKLRKKGKRHP